MFFGQMDLSRFAAADFTIDETGTVTAIWFAPGARSLIEQGAVVAMDGHPPVEQPMKTTEFSPQRRRRGTMVVLKLAEGVRYVRGAWQAPDSLQNNPSWQSDVKSHGAPGPPPVVG